MWRAFFLAIGITLCIWGAECLIVEKALLAGESPQQQQQQPLPNYLTNIAQPQQGREFTPPDWAPWSLLSSGAVVILYSFTLPRRVAAG